MCVPEIGTVGHERTNSYEAMHRCSLEDLGSGWQQDQNIVIYKRSGISNNTVRHIIHRRRDVIPYSHVLNVTKYLLV